MSLTLTLKDNGGNEVSGIGSSITLQNTVVTDFTKFDLYGDTTQQTYTGKNLFDVNGQVVAQNSSTYSISDGSITVTQSNTNQHNALIGIKIPNSENLLGKTINISLNAKSYSGGTGGRVILWDNAASQAFITLNNPDAQGNMSGSVTLPNSLPGSSTFFVLYFYTNKSNAGGSAGAYTVFTNVQIEVNSQQTSYEPYTGGVASPNPDYPQTIHTVSGEQTITISDGNSQSQSYTVDLGSIELCKIGDYQDYIYKSGDDWYVHKETGNQDMSALSGLSVISAGNFIASGFASTYGSVIGEMLSNIFTYSDTSWERVGKFGIAASGNLWAMTGDSTITTANVATWLSDKGAVVYYALATPTDTKITDNTLIGQLEAVLGAGTYNGTTIITSVAEDLPVIMDVAAGSSINEKTYTEVELSDPLTITDVEGKSSITTLNGNVYVDYVYNKKEFTVSIFNLNASDYAEIRGFYDRQFTLHEFPTITIPELGISDMVVYFQIGNREINSQCIRTDKLTLKFRETAQQ